LDIYYDDLFNFSRQRDGNNFPIYDSGLVLMLNFDNISSLGEVTGSVVKDFSHYGNHGSVSNANWIDSGKW